MRGYEGAKVCLSFLEAYSSLVLMLHSSPHGVQVPVSPAFSLFTSAWRYWSIFIASGCLNVCLLGTHSPDAGIYPAIKASSEILFIVCLVPKHKLTWRMGCLMETLLDCHVVLVTFWMCQIPVTLNPIAGSTQLFCDLAWAASIYSCFTL